MIFNPAILLTIIAALVIPMLGMMVGSESKANASSQAKPTLVSLEESISPLVEHFNANKDKYRFVALLSPT